MYLWHDFPKVLGKDQNDLFHFFKIFYIMKSILTFLFSLVSLLAMAQSNMIIFSENGGKFYVFMNGVQQNNNPEANVKIMNIPGNGYQVRIVFQDNTIPNVTRNVPFDPEEPQEYTMVVKQDRKGKYSLKWFTQGPVNNTIANGQFGVYFGGTPVAPAVVATPAPAPTPAPTPNTNTNTQYTYNQNTQVTQPSQSSSSTTTVTTTTTTTTVTDQTGNVGINTQFGVNDGVTGEQVNFNLQVGVDDRGANVNVGINGTGINTNVNVSDPNAQTTYQENVTVTTTTTTTSSQSGNWNNQNDPNWNNNQQNNNQQNNNQNWNNQPQGSGGLRCFVISDVDFKTAEASIKKKNFEDDRYTLAQQVTRNNCMNAKQIAAIMKIFHYEETRLKYAKFAHPFCADPFNYYLVNESFQYSSSIQELEEAIKP
jgi:hypothetical protein